MCNVHFLVRSLVLKSSLAILKCGLPVDMVGVEELPATFNNAEFDVVHQENNALVVKIKDGYKPAYILNNFLKR